MTLFFVGCHVSSEAQYSSLLLLELWVWEVLLKKSSGTIILSKITSEWKMASQNFWWRVVGRVLMNISSSEFHQNMPLLEGYHQNMPLFEGYHKNSVAFLVITGMKVLRKKVFSKSFNANLQIFTIKHYKCRDTNNTHIWPLEVGGQSSQITFVVQAL